MPGIADMLVQQAGETAQKAYAPDIAGSINSGVQLAAHIENIQQQRQMLEMKKQELYNQKVEKIAGLYETAAKLPSGSARSNLTNKFIPNTIKALGMEKDFGADVVKTFEADPTIVPFLKAQVQDGKTTYPEIMSHAKSNDVKWFLDQFPQLEQWNAQNELGSQLNEAVQNPELGKAEEFRLREAAAQKRAETMSGSRNVQAGARLDEQAAQAVQRINNDDPIKMMTGQHRNIDKGLQLLNDPKHPPTVITMNELAQDFSTALSGKGVSSDFKVKEINPSALESEISKLKGFIESDPNQPAPPEVVKFWRHMGERLQSAYDQQLAARAKVLSQEAKTVYANNPNAVKAAEGIARSYMNGSWSGKGPSVNVGGVKMTPAQAKKFFKANPKFQPTPEQLRLIEPLPSEE